MFFVWLKGSISHSKFGSESYKMPILTSKSITIHTY